MRVSASDSVQNLRCQGTSKLEYHCLQPLEHVCRDQIENSSSESEIDEGHGWARTLRADELRHTLAREVGIAACWAR